VVEIERLWVLNRRNTHSLAHSLLCLFNSASTNLSNHSTCCFMYSMTTTRVGPALERYMSAALVTLAQMSFLKSMLLILLDALLLLHSNGGECVSRVRI